MKKLLYFALVICLLFISSVHATIQFGAKAGLALSDQKFTYSSSLMEYDSDWRPGVAAGFFAERAIAPNLAIRLEALYVQKGHQIDIRLMEDDLTPGPVVTYRYRVDVLSINLLARGFLPFGTYAMAGPRLDLKLGTAGDFESDPVFQLLEEDYSSAVFGMTAGIGQEYRIAGVGAVFIEGQYYLDFGKLYKRDPNIAADTHLLKSIENKSLAVSLGVRF